MRKSDWWTLGWRIVFPNEPTDEDVDDEFVGVLPVLFKWICAVDVGCADWYSGRTIFVLIE